MTDRTQDMTIHNLPPADNPEQQIQLDLLKQVAVHPDDFRLVFFHLPADLRLHAKYALINKWENKHVAQVNIADFTRELIEAIHKGTWLSDMNRYQEPEILLVDDWQLITGKDATQESFYASVLKPRLEGKNLLTVIFSEQAYTELSPVLRDDLRNLLKLGFHNLD